MRRQVLVSSREEKVKVAILEDDALVGYATSDMFELGLTGKIYLGRVMNIVPSLNAVFVDIGLNKNGFLEYNSKQTDVGNELSAGQEVIVQVEKDPVGSKGPRLTRNIKLSGHYIVLQPDEDYLTLSRKITNADERARLMAMATELKPEGVGLILRTEAQGVNEDDLKREVDALRRRWRAAEASRMNTKAPAIIDQGRDIFSYCLNDCMTEATTDMLVEGRDAFEHLERAMKELKPDFAGRLREYTGEGDLFLIYGVRTKLEKALARHVWLKSGAYIVIDTTEAMTVIDVNSGKFTPEGDPNEAALQVNLEAAALIARLLRLLDIGGIIVIDFIDMTGEEYSEKLLDQFSVLLKRDSAKPTVVGMTKLGLVEMTRTRTNLSLGQRLTAKCPKCAGTGLISRMTF